MKLKRITALALSICMIIGIFAGCGGKENAEKKTTGRYVEENVELPLQQNELILRLTKNAEGKLEVYTWIEGERKYFKYISSDGKEWKQEDASWIGQIPNSYLVSVTAGADGNSYALVADKEEQKHLLRQTGQGTAEEINIPELNGLGNEFYPFGTDLKVMENGNIVLAGEKAAKVYDAANGKLLHTFSYRKNSTDGINPIAVNGGKLALPNKDSNGFTVWDVEKEQEEGNASYGSDVREGRIVLDDDNGIYFINEEGIHHMNQDGTLVETLAEGGNMAMGMPGMYLEDFIKGTDNDFYVSYATNGVVIKHYYYDKNAKTTSDKKLNIYSLKENDTIRQAANIFQQKFPEVEVTYKTGESDSSTTKADKIRVLNTELLNKSGADILVLDDLPIESFIEKGVLKDISGVINPLIEDGTLQKNLAECYQEKDGKIYSIPVKYGIPILYGNQEKIDTMKKLDTLESWLDSNPEEKLIEEASYTELTRLFVNMYYDELFEESGKLKEDKLKQCISCVKKTGERYGAEIETSYVDENGESLEAEEDSYVSGWQAGYEDSIARNQIVSEEVQGLVDMMVSFTIMRENGFPLRFNGDTFVPHGLVGINSASQNAELAEEFVKVLFSDEVQKIELFDGFPMNQNVAVRLKEQGLDSIEDESTDLSMLGNGEDGNWYAFTYPLKTEIENLMERSKELMKPAKADSILLDMIMEEAKAYYEGSQELEETIAAISAKVDTYRAE